MAVLVPVKGSPGEFYAPHLGKTIQIVEWREDDKYDTVVYASGAMTAGLTKHFFRDLDNKEAQDTNFTTPRRLPAGEEMILDRVGLYVPLFFGDTTVRDDDALKVIENGHFKVKINKSDVGEGPFVKFPSGYGISGQTTATDRGIVSIGVPSSAAASKLIREQYLTKDHDISATAQHNDRTWDTTNMPALGGKVQLKCFLHGLIKSAATKG